MITKCTKMILYMYRILYTCGIARSERFIFKRKTIQLHSINLTLIQVVITQLTFQLQLI